MIQRTFVAWPLILLMLVGLCSVGPEPTYAVITPKGQQGCAAGTVVGGPNLVRNGNFADKVDLQFETQLPNRGTGSDGLGVFPDDTSGGGFSIQTGPRTYTQNALTIGRTFPGDPQRDVPASATYFYSNPNKDTNGQPLYGDGAPGVAMLWRQVVPVVENTTYNFFAYFDNLLDPSVTGTSSPKIELRVDGVAAGPTITVPQSPDQWVSIQYSFTTGPGQTSATLEIFDLANDMIGDDFGMTQINLKQCVSGLASAKYAYPVIGNDDGTFTVRYLFTLRNLGVDVLGLRNIQLVDDLGQTFANADAFSIINLESSGLTRNPGFNGSSDKNMLTGDDVLGPGVTGTLLLTVRVTPGEGAGGRGPFQNSGQVSAEAGNLEVTDLTAPDILPDPNGNGNPKEPAEDIPTEVELIYTLNLPFISR